MAFPNFSFKRGTALSRLDSLYWEAEDSGYHTSHTPVYFECSDLSSQTHSEIKTEACSTSHKPDLVHSPYLNLVQRRITPETNGGNEYHQEKPRRQRAVKRLFHEMNADISARTPTRGIAGVLNRLHFDDDRQLTPTYKSFNSVASDRANSNIYNTTAAYSSFPTTPLKKRCRSSCMISESLKKKKLPKSLDFTVHSISCEKTALLPIENCGSKYASKPNKKLDILKMLFRNGNSMPPIKKIFSYLSHQDVYNAAKVSLLWSKICQNVWSEKSKKGEYLDFLNGLVENLENHNNNKTLAHPHEINSSTPKLQRYGLIKPLADIQNLYQSNLISTILSPTKSPRTTRFKKFTKWAELDSRSQLQCVKCQLPAKVTIEISGEEWVECMSMTCSYQFCKNCKYDRHSGKPCSQFDLDGPSPSKRKKSAHAICTKKSRRNLRRLL